MKTRCWLLLGLSFQVFGCSAVPEDPFLGDFKPVLPTSEPVESAPTGSLYVSGRTDWFGQRRAAGVGDSVTILLRESTQAARSQNVTVSRESENNVLTPQQVTLLAQQADRLLGRGQGFLNVPETFNGASVSSEGAGESGQSASLDGSVTATIIEVLANGNMVIQGEKLLTMSEGSERMRVRGIIRPQDISQNNTVLSYRLANAQISYEGRGDLTNAARPGWGTRFFNRVWPF